MKSGQSYFDVAVLFLRIPVGARLVYGTIDNIVSWDRMLEFRDFLSAHNFPIPLVSAVVSVYAQFVCGIAIAVGFKIRYAATLMAVNFILAIIGVHSGDDFTLLFAPMIILCIAIFLMLAGGGKWAIKD